MKNKYVFIGIGLGIAGLCIYTAWKQSKKTPAEQDADNKQSINDSLVLSGIQPITK